MAALLDLDLRHPYVKIQKCAHVVVIAPCLTNTPHQRETQQVLLFFNFRRYLFISCSIWLAQNKFKDKVSQLRPYIVCLPGKLSTLRPLFTKLLTTLSPFAWALHSRRWLAWDSRSDGVQTPDINAKCRTFFIEHRVLLVDQKIDWRYWNCCVGIHSIWKFAMNQIIKLVGPVWIPR